MQRSATILVAFTAAIVAHAGAAWWVWSSHGEDQAPEVYRPLNVLVVSPSSSSKMAVQSIGALAAPERATQPSLELPAEPPPNDLSPSARAERVNQASKQKKQLMHPSTPGAVDIPVAEIASTEPAFVPAETDNEARKESSQQAKPLLKHPFQHPDTDVATEPVKVASVAATVFPAVNEEVQGHYKGLLEQHLQKFRKYPRLALKRKHQGTTRLSFTLNHQGKLQTVEVATSSGKKLLDQAALDTVKAASPMPAPPEGAGLSFTLPVEFKLD